MKKKQIIIPLITIPVLLLTACNGKTENGIKVTDASEYGTPIATVTNIDENKEEHRVKLYEFDKNLPNRPNVWNALQNLYDNADDKINGFPVYYRDYVSDDKLADIYTNYILLPDYQAVYIRAEADYNQKDYETTSTLTTCEPNGYYTLCFRSYNDKFTYNGENAFNLELPFYPHHYLVSDFFPIIKYYNNGILGIDLSETVAKNENESLTVYVSPQTNALNVLQNDRISKAKNFYAYTKKTKDGFKYEMGVIENRKTVPLETDVPYYKILRIDSLLFDDDNTTPIVMQPIVHEVIKQEPRDIRELIEVFPDKTETEWSN